ncbi:MAG TPA: hypothetical protein VHL14_08620 [Steroidobacteraceae bacterium]|nr:hypothetical protein [Steroidobacteraceae bacterium]
MTKKFFPNLLLLAVVVLVHPMWCQAAAKYETPPMNCADAPEDGEAFIYTGQNFSGTCFRLTIDPKNAGLNSFFIENWTSWDATTGFPNDKTQSVWMGSGATLVLFWNSFNTKDNSVPLHFGPGEIVASLGGWNGKASAARIQRFAFGNCGATPDRLVLITDANFNLGGENDCTELNWNAYNTPVSMGFRNDTVSSVISTFSRRLVFPPSTFVDNVFLLASDVNTTGDIGSYFQVCPGARLVDLNFDARSRFISYKGGGSPAIVNFNDSVSAIYAKEIVSWCQ